MVEQEVIQVDSQGDTQEHPHAECPVTATGSGNSLMMVNASDSVFDAYITKSENARELADAIAAGDVEALEEARALPLPSCSMPGDTLCEGNVSTSSATNVTALPVSGNMRTAPSLPATGENPDIEGSVGAESTAAASGNEGYEGDVNAAARTTEGSEAENDTGPKQSDLKHWLVRP